MSQRNSGYDRKQNEAYFTPAWVVDCLIDAYPEDFSSTYDPCCGDGQIIKAIRNREKKAGGSDIHFYGFQPGDVDFLEMKMLPEGYKNIVTNPPYGKGGKLAEDFIRKSIELVKPRNGKVALLLRSDFDSAKGRRDLFGDNEYFAGEIKLLKRIQWTNLVHTASPSQNHTWFVWDTEYLPVRIPYKGYSHPEDRLGGLNEQEG